MIMKQECATFALSALGSMAMDNQDEEIKATIARPVADYVAIEITDRHTRESATTAPYLLKRYQAIAEAWGATAWVEWDPDRNELVIILS
jgi:hypothetical protein